MDQRSTIIAVDNLNGVKVLGRMIRVDHVHQYKLPKDLEKLDQDKRKLFEEGCAPKEINAVVSETSDEEEVVVKKEKKKHKKKKRRYSSSSQTYSSESEEEVRSKERNQRIGDIGEQGKGGDSGWERSNKRARDHIGTQEQSLEDRLRAMANYVKQGGGGSQGVTNRVTAKDMFEKEEIIGASIKKRSMSRERKSGNSRENNERRTQRRERSSSRQKGGDSEDKMYRESASGERQTKRRHSRDIGRGVGGKKERSMSSDTKGRSRTARSISQESRGRRDRSRPADRRRSGDRRRTKSSSSSSI